MKRVLVCLLTVCLLLGCCVFGVSAQSEANVTVTNVTWEGDEKANQGESVETAQFVDAYLRDDEGQVDLTPDFENHETLMGMETAFSELSAERQAELDTVAKREVGETMAQVINDAKQFKADMEAFVAEYALDGEGAVLNTELLDACKVIVGGERK